jgi:hypothetical protein
MDIISGSAGGIIPALMGPIGNTCLICAPPRRRWKKDMVATGNVEAAVIWGMAFSEFVPSNQLQILKAACRNSLVGGRADDGTMFIVADLTYDTPEAGTEFIWDVASELTSVNLYDGGTFVASSTALWVI